MIIACFQDLGRTSSDKARLGYLGAWVRIMAGVEMFIFTASISAVGPPILLFSGTSSYFFCDNAVVI
jgi:hypothetical protein